MDSTGALECYRYRQLKHDPEDMRLLQINDEIAGGHVDAMTCQLHQKVSDSRDAARRNHRQSRSLETTVVVTGRDFWTTSLRREQSKGGYMGSD
jgi:hypothetical protein